MAQMEKELNRKRTFQARFREQYNKKYVTQSELGNIVGVSRQTVASWLNGENTPDIMALAKIAEFYEVSTDYLLGFSDMVTPDVNARAAAEYTGLSEAAVEWLHIGLDNFECDGVKLSEEMKKQNLSTASDFIQSRSFSKMIHHLKEASLEAYMERVLRILDAEYSECDLPEDDPNFRYARKEDRDVVVKNHVHVLIMKKSSGAKETKEWVEGMDDETLASDVARAMFSAGESNELHQFHAAKAFTGYIDEVVQKSQEKAEQRFRKIRAE